MAGSRERFRGRVLCCSGGFRLAGRWGEHVIINGQRSRRRLSRLWLLHRVIRQQLSVLFGFEGHVVSRVWFVVEERSQDPGHKPGNSK